MSKAYFFNIPAKQKEKSVLTGEWRLVEGQEAEADALGHVNSILVVGEHEMDEEGAGVGTLDGSTVHSA